MANITITETDVQRRKGARLKSTLWFVALILMILVRFWNYWSTLI